MEGHLESPDEAHIEKQETISFEKAAKEIKDGGYILHEQEHDRGGRDPKIYHTSEHPRTLERRAEQMAEVLRLSPKQRAVVRMAIAWHDTVIEYDSADPNDLLATVRRHRGAREGDQPNGVEGNEAKSAALLEHKMRETNELAKQEVFTEEQIHIARWAIEATYPDVNFGPDSKGAAFEEYPYYEASIAQNPSLAALFNELKIAGIIRGPLFFQPHLEHLLEAGHAVPREVLTVALIDLGAAGMAEKEVFFQEGDSEMRELYANLLIPDTMRRLVEGEEEADQIDREKTVSVFLGWLESQPGFAAWQFLRFEKILYLLRQMEALTPEEEEGLRAPFDHFADNVRATRDRAGELKRKFEEVKSASGERVAFRYLAENLHYEIP